jgi:hypothetical protein
MMIDPKLPAIHHFLLSIGFEVQDVFRFDGFDDWKTVHYRLTRSHWTLSWTWNRNGSETWNAPSIPSGAPMTDDDSFCFVSASDAIERKNRHPRHPLPVWRKELAARIRAVEAPPHGQSSIL